MQFALQWESWRLAGFAPQAELEYLFDHSVDYTGHLTAGSGVKPATDPTEGGLSGKIDVVNNDRYDGPL